MGSWGLRRRLFWGLALIIAVAVALQVTLGYASFQRGVEVQIVGYLERFGERIRDALDLSGARPRLTETIAPSTLKRFRYRLLEMNRVVLEPDASFSFPPHEADWVFGRLNLPGNRALEYAFDAAEDRIAPREYLRTSLIALPVTLALALAVTWGLVRLLLRPVRELNLATEAMSLERFPAPVRVPPGEDELSKLAESFNRMTDALRGVFERERSFTRYASHELRTPLSSFRAQVEALELDLLPREEVIPNLKLILGRMESILAGLLALTRTPKLDLEPFSPSGVARAVLDGLSEHEDRVRIRLESSPALARGQPELVKQAVQNLVENALRYSEGRIEVSLERHGGEVAVQVRDFGPGVPEDAIPRLTEPFFRLEGRSHGLGLGLALVSRVARSSGGRLELRNAHPGFEARLVLLTAERAAVEIA